MLRWYWVRLGVWKIWRWRGHVMVVRMLFASVRMIPLLIMYKRCFNLDDNMKRCRIIHQISIGYKISVTHDVSKETREWQSLSFSLNSKDKLFEHQFKKIALVHITNSINYRKVYTKATSWLFWQHYHSDKSNKLVTDYHISLYYLEFWIKV